MGTYELDAVARVQGEESNAAPAGSMRDLASNRAEPDRRLARSVRRQQRERADLARHISASHSITEAGCISVLEGTINRCGGFNRDERRRGGNADFSE